jgi:excisionase family DNA binding protein
MIMGMTTIEAAHYLGIQKGFVARLCKKGILIAKKHGRDWDIDPRSVEEYKNAPKNKGGRPRKEPKSDQD